MFKKLILAELYEMAIKFESPEVRIILAPARVIVHTTGKLCGAFAGSLLFHSSCEMGVDSQWERKEALYSWRKDTGADMRVLHSLYSISPPFVGVDSVSVLEVAESLTLYILSLTHLTLKD